MTIHQLNLTVIKKIAWPQASKYLKPGAYILVVTYFSVTMYSAYIHDIGYPLIWLNYILLILVSSVLIGPRVGVVVAFFANLLLGFMSYLQIGLVDSVPLMATCTVVAAFAWLSNKEVRKERDKLELMVEERTQELRNVQIARIAELHRMAESGHLAAGYFHDLMNPLTALALSVKSFATENSARAKILNISLKQAISASRRMEIFIEAIRNQGTPKENIYSLNDEVRQIIELLQYKAEKNDIDIAFVEVAHFVGHGSALPFTQMVSNLLSNAIEAFEDSAVLTKQVSLKLEVNEKYAKVIVSDNGPGISKKLRTKIFTPFYTSKDAGTGLGLAITKNVVEKELGGKIDLESSKKGTEFTVTFPLGEKFRIK